MFQSNMKYDNETSALKTLNMKKTVTNCVIMTSYAEFATLFVFVVDLFLQITTIFTIHIDSINLKYYIFLYIYMVRKKTIISRNKYSPLAKLLKVSSTVDINLHVFNYAAT